MFWNIMEEEKAKIEELEKKLDAVNKKLDKISKVQEGKSLLILFIAFLVLVGVTENRIEKLFETTSEKIRSCSSDIFHNTQKLNDMTVKLNRIHEDIQKIEDAVDKK